MTSAHADSAKAAWRWLEARGPWPAAALGVLCFLTSLGNQFTYDDVEIVERNPRVQDVLNFREIWLADWWFRVDTEDMRANPHRDRLYRPLTLHSFAANYAVHGLDPAGFHAVNVALHGVCCGLVWWWALLLARNRAVATLCALWFAAHPMHAEAVANIVGRAEVLAAIFLLCGQIVLLRGPGPPGAGRTLAAGGLFLLALLSKETAICYPPLALLAIAMRWTGWVFPAARDANPHRPLTRTWWLLHAALLLAPLLVYFPLRYVALDQHLIRSGPLSLVFNPLLAASTLGRIVGPFTVLGHYAWMLLAPTHLAADYGLGVVPRFGDVNAVTLLGFAAAGAWLWVVAGALRRDSSARAHAAVAGMLLASYALMSNTVLLIGVSVAERLAYWPSAPALLLLAMVLNRAWTAATVRGTLQRAAPVLRVAGGALLVALALRTSLRSLDWYDNHTLFAADVQTFPNNVQLNSSHGRHLANRAAQNRDGPAALAQLAEAERFLQRALSVDASNSEALATMGYVYALRGDKARALQYLDAARQFNPREVAIARDILLVLGQDEALERRFAELAAQVEQQPQDAELRLQFSRELLAASRYLLARAHLERVVELRPEWIEPRKLLMQALVLDHELERAAELGAQVVAADPNDWETHVNLSFVLGGRDNPAALRHAQAALRLRPDDLRVQFNLAASLTENGRRADAISVYRRIEQMLPTGDPRLASVRERIAELQRAP